MLGTHKSPVHVESTPVAYCFLRRNAIPRFGMVGSTRSTSPYGAPRLSFVLLHSPLSVIRSHLPLHHLQPHPTRTIVARFLRLLLPLDHQFSELLLAYMRRKTV
jgi:hypothetical protein